MGGKPSRGTSKDMRLSANKPGGKQQTKSKPPATGGAGSWSSQNKPVKKG